MPKESWKGSHHILFNPEFSMHPISSMHKSNMKLDTTGYMENQNNTVKPQNSIIQRQ